MYASESWSETEWGPEGSCRSNTQWSMPGESCHRQLRSLLFCVCDVFWALINSLVCQFWRVLSYGQRNGACSSMPQSATESWAWHDSQPHPSSSPTPETTPSSRRHPPTHTKEFISLWQPSTDPPYQHHHRESKPHPGIPSSESQALPNSLQTCGTPIWHSSTHSRSTEPSSGASISHKTLTSYNKSSRLQHTSQPGTIGPKHLGSCWVSSPVPVGSPPQAWSPNSPWVVWTSASHLHVQVSSLSWPWPQPSADRLPPLHTPSITFWHLPPNSARFSYATEGALFISVQLSTDTVSALWKVWVLIRL